MYDGIKNQMYDDIKNQIYDGIKNQIMMASKIKCMMASKMLIAAAFIGKLPANLHSKVAIIMKYIFQVIIVTNPTA